MEYLGFDFKNPDYVAVIARRLKALAHLRANPEILLDIRDYYRDHPWDFINDWGITYDPRNLDLGLPAYLPMVLFPKQIEFCQYVVRKWKARENGLCEKSRDVGITWTAGGLAATLCLFNEGMAIGFGSRKEQLVDQVGSMKPILPKIRLFLQNVPQEFTGSWDVRIHAPYMRILFPDTGSFIGGEAGDDIGRGDRTTLYFVDEAAHLKRPETVEASLSETTRCRIDMSSVKGMNNPFARKRHEGLIEPFIFDWRDDPRKDDAWYEKRCLELDPVVVAQEIDRDYSASVHGIVCPGAWVRSSIDAATKLGIRPTGKQSVSLDVADEGMDKNAIIGRRGIEINFIRDWSGKGADLFATTQTAFEICDELGVRQLKYDADGLGAGVRGDARVINDARNAINPSLRIAVMSFRGSGAVRDPTKFVEPDMKANDPHARKNEDFFANRKAQEWWGLRKRFERTYAWVTRGVKCDPDDIISISSQAKGYLQLVSELSQATFETNGVGKIVINKKPDNTRSPNLADACMMEFAPMLNRGTEVPEGFLRNLAAMRGHG